MITIINPRNFNGNPNSPNGHRSDMMEGLKNLGIDFKTSTDGNVNTDKVIVWGWRKGKALRDRGHNVLVMERGYIGDRFKYTSLGWNGLNGHATFPACPDDGGERFRNHGGNIIPWNKEGDYILLLGQVKGDASLKGKDITSWYVSIAEKARKAWNLPVYFRPHPEGIRRGGYYDVGNLPHMQGSLQSAINGALFTIAYNSNSCLDSIMSGKPCFAGDKGTMVWDLCMSDVDDLVYPDREDKLHSIAWTQWSSEEIRNGTALKGLF